MYVVDLPLRVQISKNTKFILNLNHYRNAHWRQLDPAKKAFKQAVQPLILDLPVFERVEIHYTFFAPDNRLSDTSNITSIVDKFFCDALVECGKLSDDNRLVVVETRSRFGGVDKGRPRVEACIVPVRDNLSQLQ